MNYIKQLQDEKVRLTAATTAALTGLEGMLVYLQSDKFHEDTTVQVQDMINRIRATREAIYDEAFK